MQRNDAPRILAVDDDLTIVELIRAVLTDEGFVVDVALNGRQALECCRKNHPALVVLDMYLPGISGPNLADALREMCGGPLPILVISASNVDEEAQRLGAYEYLPKPFELEHLVAAVRRGLSRR